MAYTELISSPESLGNVLRQARRPNGLSQRELARWLGTTQRYIWEFEAGKHSIVVDRLFALLGLTGTSLIAVIDPDHADVARPATSRSARPPARRHAGRELGFDWIPDEIFESGQGFRPSQNCRILPHPIRPCVPAEPGSECSSLVGWVRPR